MFDMPKPENGVVNVCAEENVVTMTVSDWRKIQEFIAEQAWLPLDLRGLKEQDYAWETQPEDGSTSLTEV